MLVDWFLAVDRRARLLSETISLAETSGASQIEARRRLALAAGESPLSVDTLMVATQLGLTADEVELLGYLRFGNQIADAIVQGSPPSLDVFLHVLRNSDPTDFVCIDGLTHQNPQVALHVSCHAIDWFLEGDYVELFVTPNRTVEPNWPGRGNISPLLSVHRLH